jgi:hypothetical protein
MALHIGDGVGGEKAVAAFARIRRIAILMRSGLHDGTSLWQLMS